MMNLAEWNWGYIVFVYLVAINVVTFCLYGIDKWKARRSRWRIEEATLLWWAAAGGSIGALCGMKIWRHKTLHRKFTWGVPAILVAQITLAGALLLTSCSRPQATFIPEPPDYRDTTMWVTIDADTTGNGADIFYIVSTWETDWMHDSTVCHYADVWNEQHRAHMAIEIHRAAAYMAPGNRFYAPYYRHTTIEGWMTCNDDTIRRRTRLSMGDVCQAFDLFIMNRDNCRPLIIAGFSQGGLAVVELLKHMSNKT